MRRVGLLLALFLGLGIGLWAGSAQEISFIGAVRSDWISQFLLTSGDLWVNLSPFISDSRTVSPVLKDLEVGKELLSSDLKLKEKVKDLLDGEDVDLTTTQNLVRVWVEIGSVEWEKKRGIVYLKNFSLKVRLKGLEDYFPEDLVRDLEAELSREVNESEDFSKLRGLVGSFLIARFMQEKGLRPSRPLPPVQRSFWSRSYVFGSYLRDWLFSDSVVGAIILEFGGDRYRILGPEILPGDTVYIPPERRKGRGDSSGIWESARKAEDFLQELAQELGIRLDPALVRLVQGMVLTPEEVEEWRQVVETVLDGHLRLRPFSLEVQSGSRVVIPATVFLFLLKEKCAQSLSIYPRFSFWKRFPRDANIAFKQIKKVETQLGNEEALEEVLGFSLLDVKEIGRYGVIGVIKEEDGDNWVYCLQFWRSGELVSDFFDEAMSLDWFSQLAREIGLTQPMPSIVKVNGKLTVKVDVEDPDVLNHLKNLVPLERFGPQRRTIRFFVYRIPLEALSESVESDTEERFWSRLKQASRTYYRLLLAGYQWGDAATLGVRGYNWDEGLRLLGNKELRDEVSVGPKAIVSVRSALLKSNLLGMDNLWKDLTNIERVNSTYELVEAIGRFMFAAVNLYGTYLVSKREHLEVDPFSLPNMKSESRRIAKHLEDFFSFTAEELGIPEDLRKALLETVDFDLMAWQLLAFYGDFYKEIISPRLRRKWDPEVWESTFDEVVGDTHMFFPTLAEAEASQGWGYVSFDLKEQVVEEILAILSSELRGSIAVSRVRRENLKQKLNSGFIRVQGANVYRLPYRSYAEFVAEVLDWLKMEVGRQDLVRDVEFALWDAYEKLLAGWHINGDWRDPDIGPAGGPYPCHEVAVGVSLFTAYALKAFSQVEEKAKRKIDFVLKERESKGLPQGIFGYLLRWSLASPEIGGDIKTLVLEVLDGARFPTEAAQDDFNRRFQNWRDRGVFSVQDLLTLSAWIVANNGQVENYDLGELVLSAFSSLAKRNSPEEVVSFLEALDEFETSLVKEQEQEKGVGGLRLE